MTIPLMQCQQLTKKYKDKQILKDVSFSLDESELLCVVGPSGCGKSTLLRCIAGLEQVSSGDILIEGNTVNHVSAQSRPVVMMFQQPLLFPHLSVLENTIYGLKINKINKNERTEKALQMLKSMEIEHLAKAFPHEISGGQQQRVALARALMVQPKLLLLDEPFSSLDPDLRSSLRIWVKKKLKEWNTTAIFVTHDKEEAMILADKIAVMQEGSVIQIGTPDELYKNPNSPYVAKYFSEGFFIDNVFIPLNRLVVNKNENVLNGKVDQYVCGKIVSIFYKGGQQFIQIELTEINNVLIIAFNQEVCKDELIFIGFNKEDAHTFKN
jgi:ABC-type Fe3+/spermidine/putrescine transport system ATPase subunit